MRDTFEKITTTSIFSRDFNFQLLQFFQKIATIFFQNFVKSCRKFVKNSSKFDEIFRCNSSIRHLGRRTVVRPSRRPSRLKSNISTTPSCGPGPAAEKSMISHAIHAPVPARTWKRVKRSFHSGEKWKGEKRVVAVHLLLLSFVLTYSLCPRFRYHVTNMALLGVAGNRAWKREKKKGKSH